jgi:signal transduction histidine kinase
MARLRATRHTARLRLSLLYGGLFLIMSSGLLTATYLLFQRATKYTTPKLPAVPHTPAIKALQSPQLPGALSKLAYAQKQLAHDQHVLNLALPKLKAGGPLPLGPLRLSQDQRELAHDRHQLAKVTHQVAQAIHQVAQTGPIETAQRASDSHQLLVNSGIALGAAAAIAVLLGWLVAGRVLRPVRTITATARRISATNLHERLALHDADEEFRQLGETLDALFARLEAAFDAQRHFVANAAHELRTPLTRERTLVQVALGDPSTPQIWQTAGDALLASNRDQETLIDGLLTLASGEAGLDHREQIDLADIVYDRIRDSQSDADRVKVNLDSTLESAIVDGDQRLLEALVANLIDNAILHNLKGGSVLVSTGRAPGTAVLAVRNSGPIIPQDDVDRLFQPFQRLNPSRTHHQGGHGLGLSIVRAIANAHGATVSAEPLPDGGLSIEVDFPSPVDEWSATGSGPEGNKRLSRSL